MNAKLSQGHCAPPVNSTPAGDIQDVGRLPRDSVKRVLVIKLQHFGDVLLITPLLTTLKLNYPNALIDVLLYKGTEAMLAANQTVHKAYLVERGLKKKGLKAQLKGEWALLKSLSQGRPYDLIVNLSSKFQPAIYCWLLKPRVSLAFHHHKYDFWWKLFHTMLADFGSELNEQHMVLRNLGILAPLKLPKISTAVTMAYQQADLDKVKTLSLEYGLKDYILIQPTARWAFKTWPAAAFSQLIAYLTAKGETVVLTGGTTEEDRLMVEEIIKGCPLPDRLNNLVNLVGQLTLTELAAFIDRAKLFIGVDSAPMHMAAALKTPAVVLFGPTSLKQWRPWQGPHSLLWAGDYRGLPAVNEVDTNTRERYLEAIPVRDVISAVNGWLAQINSGLRVGQ